MENNHYKEIRAAKFKLYSDRAKRLFWLHWLCLIFGHFGIILGLHFLNQQTKLWLIASPVAFHYYLKGMSVLRKKRLYAVLNRVSYRQASAEEIIASGQPYALYLREFMNENFSVGDFGISHGLGEETESLGIRIRPAHVEYLITKLLHQDIALISLTDPKNPPLPGAHRFLNIPVQWEEFIEALMEKSSPIFLYITSFTPGINKEMAILNKRKWFDKTIVLFGREINCLDARAGGNKMYKYVIYETGAKQWLRRHERALKKNLKKVLSAYEIKSNQTGKLVTTATKRIPLITPMRITAALKLLVPALGWFILTAIFLTKVVYPDRPGWDMPYADLGIMLVVYYFVRFAKAFDLQDSSYKYIEEDKLKTYWNNYQSIRI